MKYVMPKEIVSEMKFTKSLYLFDIAFVSIALMIAWVLKPLVYAPLVIVYYMFVLIIAIVLVSKSMSNPKKRNYQSIHYAFKRNRKVYIRE